MKKLLLHTIDLDIKPFIQNLTDHGILRQAPSGLVYLDVDNNYIHNIFPHINYENISKPDYFSDVSAIGAHISVIYPEEISDKLFNLEYTQKFHNFSVQNLFYTEIQNKGYFAVQITAPTLLNLRKKYNLPEQLCFKNFNVSFHITIAILNLK